MFVLVPTNRYSFSLDESKEPVVKELITEFMFNKLRLESTTGSLSILPIPDNEYC